MPKETYISELEKARELQTSLAAKLVNTGKGEGRKKRLKRAGDSLREREPWYLSCLFDACALAVPRAEGRPLSV